MHEARSAPIAFTIDAGINNESVHESTVLSAFHWINHGECNSSARDATGSVAKSRNLEYRGDTFFKCQCTHQDKEQEGSVPYVLYFCL